MKEKIKNHDEILLRDMIPVAIKTGFLFSESFINSYYKTIKDLGYSKEDSWFINIKLETIPYILSMDKSKVFDEIEEEINECFDDLIRNYNFYVCRESDGKLEPYGYVFLYEHANGEKEYFVREYIDKRYHGRHEEYPLSFKHLYELDTYFYID